MMRSFLSQTLFLVFPTLLAVVFGQQQQQPDADCTAWLATPQGQNFTECENGFPGLPMKTPDNDCTVTVDDYNLLCNDSCFTILTEGYDFILSTGTCLNLYEARFGPCSTDDNCTGDNQICFQGVCYTSCDTTTDCNSCNSETCDILQGDVRGCRSNITTRNGTSTFRGNVYMLESACITNDAGDYCSLLFAGITGNLSTVQCADFDTWGCCLGAMLTSMEYCGFERFDDSSIYQCNASQITCSTLPLAQDFCVINANETNNNGSSSGSSSGMTGSSGSSGMTGSSGSSGMTGSSGSSGITGSSMTSGNSSMTGSSGTGHTGSSGLGGTGGNNSTDGNAAGATALFSWSLLIGLLFITPVLS